MTRGSFTRLEARFACQSSVIDVSFWLINKGPRCREDYYSRILPADLFGLAVLSEEVREEWSCLGVGVGGVYPTSDEVELIFEPCPLSSTVTGFSLESLLVEDPSYDLCALNLAEGNSTVFG